MLQRILTLDLVGAVTTGLARLCAVLLIVSVLGPWDIIQYREGSHWVTIVYLGEGRYLTRDPRSGWPWILIPLSGVVLFLFLFLIVFNSWAFDPERRPGPMAVAATWFALIALVLLVATDVVQASFGLSGWTSHGVGGVRYPVRWDAVAHGWGWGAGLAWWAAVAGVIACLVDFSRALLASRRRKRRSAERAARSSFD